MNKLLMLSTCLMLAACGTPAIVAFPVGIGAGLAINNENLEEPLTSASDMGDAIVDGVVAGYSRDEYVGTELNQ